MQKVSSKYPDNSSNSMIPVTFTPPRNGIAATVGNTQLIEVKTLSRITGCKIMVKCEHMNPSGSIKDRAALWIIENAEKKN
jgi:cysteine synthase